MKTLLFHSLRCIMLIMELATLHLDTYKVVKHLQGKGFTKKQAEGFIEAIQEITLSGVATKQDVQDAKNEMLKFQIIQTIALVGVMVALFQFFS